MIRSIATATILAGLAGCAQSPTPAPSPSTTPAATSATAVPAGPASSPATGYDGVYRPLEGAVSGNSACGTTRLGYAIRVSGGVARMQTVSQGLLEGPVSPDGSLLLDHGLASLRGQFKGDAFDGTYQVRRCLYELHLRK